MQPTPNRPEAERLLSIAEKLLLSRDLVESRDFAVLAQEADPLLEGSDQIIAIADVLLAADNDRHDWYSILQIDRRSHDSDLIRKQYRRLALLLHPDRNNFPSADHSFKLVADAWAVLSDSSKKALYDNDLDSASSSAKIQVRRNQPFPAGINQSPGNAGASHHSDDARLVSFWTACPYCYTLFEYLMAYEGCCLRCQNCKRAFQGIVVLSVPPMVHGHNAYYCSWGFFPIGYATGDIDENQPEGRVGKKRGRPKK